MKKYLLLILPIFFILSGHASADCGGGFAYCRTVTVDHTKVPNTDQTSFPIEVCANSTPGVGACLSPSGLNQTGGGAHVQNSNGFDIIFTTDAACATKVAAWEVEKYTASTGELIAWVNDGTISHSVDTVFYMCYGNASISTFQSTGTSVWDANYKAVWHLPSTLTGDSTSQANNLTNHSTTATAGQIGGGAATVSSHFLSSPAITGTFTLTMSAWAKFTSSGAGFQYIVSGLNTPGSDQTELGTVGGTAANMVYCYSNCNSSGTAILAGTSDITNGSWHYLVGVRDAGGTLRIYVDGAQENSAGQFNGSVNPFTSLDIGIEGDGASNPFTGTIDEVRYSNTTRSADWIKAEYNNQSSPSTFETFGAEATAVAFIPRFLLLFGRMFISAGKLFIN